MEYIYINIYRFEGISGHDLEKDKIVYQDNANGITVLLTNNVNRHCLKLDTGLAAASLLLRGMFGGEKLQDLPIVIDAEVAKIRRKSIKEKDGGLCGHNS